MKVWIHRLVGKFILLTLLLAYWGNQGHACANLTVAYQAQAANSCIPRLVNFTNNSSGNRASTAFYSLYVNGTLVDTATGTNTDLNHTFNATGSYNIKLYARDTSGCLDSSTGTFNVTRTKPKFSDQNNLWTDAPEWLNCIQFSSDPDTFRITTSNQDSLSEIISIWDDGTRDTLIGGVIQNTSNSHTYRTSGIFFPIWITKDSAGCTDTLFGKVVNERVPTAGIIGPNSGSNIGCAPFTVSFTNNSANISTGTSFTWEFGNGVTEDFGYTNFNQKVTHTYTNALCQGTVKLTASNTCGQSFTTWNPLNISQTDRALFTIDSTNCDRTGNFSFTNISIDSFCLLPDPKSYKWDFGNGDTSAWLPTRGSISYNYKTEGPKRVCLIANNKCGNDTFCQSFEAMYRPEVGFLLDTLWGCDSLTIRVVDTSIAYRSVRRWTMGDGTTYNDSIVTHTYTSAGSYTITLSHSNRCGTETDSKDVTVYNSPDADFSPLLDGCVTHSVAPINTSTTDFLGSAQYRWVYTSMDTIAYEPGNIVLTDSGTYYVLLELTDSCGIDTAVETVRVDLIPELILSGDSVRCATDSARFNNFSRNYDFVFVDYGDGYRDTLESNGAFYHVYSVDGTYQITFFAVNQGICTHRDTLEIRIKPNASASFTANRIGACTPFGFVFTNTSKDANTFRWYINDSLVSQALQPDTIYIDTDSTILDVKLWAIDSNSCYPDSFNLEVFTSKMPEAHFSVVEDSGCGPLLDTFQNQSLFASTYLWDFGNGVTSSDTNPSVVFTSSEIQDTVYQVQLISRNWLGCADTTYGFRKIFPKPEVRFSLSDTSGCGPLPVSFTNLSNAKDTSSLGDMEFYWNTGLGYWDSLPLPSSQNYTASLLTDSIYYLELIGTTDHECRDTHNLDITVYPDPTVDFLPSDTAGCGPLHVSLSNLSVPNDTGSIRIMTFQWDFGNGVQSTAPEDSVVYQAAATADTFYSIRLFGFSEHGCQDSAGTTLQVYPKPESQFEMDTSSGCGPLPITFTNRSIPNDTGNISVMSFHWSLESGITSTARDTHHVFVGENLRDSLYSIQLVAFSEHNCTDTSIQTVLVHPRPTSDYSSTQDSGCGPLTVGFTSSAQLNDSNFWDLGNGFELAPQDTLKTFPFVLLRDSITPIAYYTRTRFGCTSDTMTSRVKVFSQPIVDFGLSDDSICYKVPVQTINQSQGVDTNDWEIDGQFYRNVLNVEDWVAPDVDPNSGRDVEIQLVGTTIHGCVDSNSTTLHVFPYPLASIADVPDSFCSPVRISFENESINYVSSVWDLDSMDTVFTNNAQKRYQNISNIDIHFTATLMVENQYACKDTTEVGFKLTPQPISNFSPFRRDVCDSGYYKLLNTSINNITNIWSADNGWASTEEEPEELFSRNSSGPASYTIQLVAENGSGCSDTSFHTLELNPFQTVQFETTPLPVLCTEDLIQFENQSRFSAFQKWTFGDGAESRDSQPAYFYKNDGTFDVKLVGYDKNGCADSVISNAMVEVAPRPVARFNYAPQFPKLPAAKVVFSNNSSPPAGLTYAWDFGDANTSSLRDPEHLYQDSGWYKVELIARSALCPDTTYRDVYIEPPFPQIAVQASDTAGCGPLEVQFVPISQDATSFRWFFDDGNESRLDSPVHVFTESGYYNITAIAYGPGGASDTTVQNMIRVYPKPRSAFFPKPKEAYLPDAYFDFTNETVGASRHTWFVYFSETQALVRTEEIEHLGVTLNTVGEYDVLLISENGFGCLDSVFEPMVIKVLDGGELYVPNAFTPNEKHGNDVFIPSMQGVREDDYQLTIYNRWGEKLFQTTDVNQGWDGVYLGRPSPIGQYIFTIKGSFISGEQFDEKGTVFLLR
jgi:gliding motility-associated-like protein